MKRLLLILFALLPLTTVGCAKTGVIPHQIQTAASTTPTHSKSQKRDASLIYGDKKLNQAYETWAKEGYPTHPDARKYDLEGEASWYGPGLNGNKTASGETFDMHGMTAAHKKLPFGSVILITNKNNGKSVVVRINDRGPFTRGRVVDLSYGAAYLIDMVRAGLAPVHIDIISLPETKK